VFKELMYVYLQQNVFVRPPDTDLPGVPCGLLSDFGGVLAAARNEIRDPQAIGLPPDSGAPPAGALVSASSRPDRRCGARGATAAGRRPVVELEDPVLARLLQSDKPLSAVLERFVGRACNRWLSASCSGTSASRGSCTCPSTRPRRALTFVENFGEAEGSASPSIASRNKAFSEDQENIVCPWHGYELDIATARHQAIRACGSTRSRLPYLVVILPEGTRERICLDGRAWFCTRRGRATGAMQATLSGGKR
jgi:hypothetical protein